MAARKVREAERFTRLSEKLDTSIKIQLEKLMGKIIENPEIGKPMRYVRKGTREVYLGSFRVSYEYVKEEELIIFLDIYHKDEQ